jgi:cyclomaltodextrinase
MCTAPFALRVSWRYYTHMIEELPTGLYRHYKGNEYEVLYIGTHTESGERLVVYRDVHDTTKVWLRPVAMFLETVEVDGETVPRFERIG